MGFRMWGGMCGMAALVVAPAVAQSASQADRHYILEAIETNDAEIAAAHLALENSTSYGVKQFALLMIHDHTVMNDQMRPVAKRLGVQVAPDQVSGSAQQLAVQLKGLKAAAFDRRYLAAMVEGHEKALNETKTEAAESQFPAVKSVAERAEPIIEQHLQMAQTLVRQNQ